MLKNPENKYRKNIYKRLEEQKKRFKKFKYYR